MPVHHTSNLETPSFSYGEEKLAAPQGSPLSGEQEKHGLLFEWPRRKRSPFPCERTVPFDNDMKRFLCHPTPSTTPGRLLIRWPQRVGLGRVSHGAYCCIRFYRSPVGSEEPLAESSQASLWETGRSHPCPQAPGFSREVLDNLVNSKPVDDVRLLMDYRLSTAIKGWYSYIPAYLKAWRERRLTVIRNLPKHGQAILSVRFLLRREEFHLLLRASQRSSLHRRCLSV